MVVKIALLLWNEIADFMIFLGLGNSHAAKNRKQVESPYRRVGGSTNFLQFFKPSFEQGLGRVVFRTQFQPFQLRPSPHCNCFCFCALLLLLLLRLHASLGAPLSPAGCYPVAVLFVSLRCEKLHPCFCCWWLKWYAARSRVRYLILDWTFDRPIIKEVYKRKGTNGQGKENGPGEKGLRV